MARAIEIMYEASRSRVYVGLVFEGQDFSVFVVLLVFRVWEFGLGQYLSR